VADHRLSPSLSAPATPEEVLRAVDELKARLARRDGAASDGRVEDARGVTRVAATAAAPRIG
jgi:hypothetical protein